MVKVDPEGRVVLPQEIRESLGISPGMEVEIREEDGKAVIEPADKPKQILERMEQLVQESSSRSRETRPLNEKIDPIAQDHRDAIQRGAEDNNQ